jgi:hypothetical protein
MSGKTDILALTRGDMLDVHYLPSGAPERSLDLIDRIDAIPSRDAVNVTDIFEYFGGIDVESLDVIKVSEDGASLVVFGKGEEHLSAVVRFELGITGRDAPIANYPVLFNSSLLSEEEIESGLSLVRFPADASFMAVRISTLEGSRIRMGSLNILPTQYSEVQGSFLQNKSLTTDFTDERGDFALSYDAGVYIQVDSGGSEAYGKVPRCPSGFRHYRMSIELDDNPKFVSWSIETYRTLGNLQRPSTVLRECDGCYSDNSRFGRCIIAEDGCIRGTNDPCLRVRFQSLVSKVDRAWCSSGMELR